LENFELKAHCPDPDQAEEKARVLGAEWQWKRLQRDTYFHARQGRLKLRQVEGEKAELIAYRRPALAEGRMSRYEIFYTSDAVRLQSILAAALTVAGVVEKTRTLYLWKNIRIHLDRVVRLGAFIEFEAVLQNEEEAVRAPEELAHLEKEFDIRPGQRVGEGYFDLLMKLQS